MRFVSNDRVVSAETHSLVEPPTKLEQNRVEILHEHRCRNVKQKGHASSSSGVAGTGLPAIPGMPRPPFSRTYRRERRTAAPPLNPRREPTAWRVHRARRAVGLSCQGDVVNWTSWP